MKKILRIFVFMLAIFLVVGCSGNQDEETATNDTENDVDQTTEEEVTEEEETEVSKEIDNLKVAYMPNFASLNLVVAGMNIGAFEEEGIEIELVEFADGPTIIAAMESGSIDIGYIGPGAHVLSVQGSADIFAFSQMGNADEVIGNT